MNHRPQRAMLPWSIGVAIWLALLASGCSISTGDMLSTSPSAPTAVQDDAEAGATDDPALGDTGPSQPDPTATAPPIETGEAGDTVPSQTDPTATPEASVPTPTEQADARFVVVEGELPITEARLVEFIEYVETQTARDFLRPPRIAVQTVAEFEAGLQPSDEDIVEAMATAEVDARSLQALGQTTLGPDALLQVLLETFTDSDLILGYFDPEEDTLYVPAEGAADSELESVLVHELVHALDHQYVDLEQLLDVAEQADRDRTEGSFELFSVAEGRASWVQNRWLDDNGDGPNDDVDLDALAAVPAVALLELSLPYELGERLIDDLGGPDETWDLYTDLPASSEQAMFANRLGVDAPTSLPFPVSDGPVLDRGVLGAEAIVLWLLGHTLDFSAPEATLALTAADGWSGGAWVLWGDDSENCLRAEIAGDTSDDLDELVAAFEAWQRGASGRGVDAEVGVRDGVLRATACAPFIP